MYSVEVICRCFPLFPKSFKLFVHARLCAPLSLVQRLFRNQLNPTSDTQLPSADKARRRTSAQTTTMAETTTAAPAPAPDSELTTALRTQVTDLLTQVTQLNSKLVSSYDRISDLEDSVHISSHQLRQHTIKISEMDLEREKHRSMIEGGLLVEKAHVTQELNRMMVEASLSKRAGDEDRKTRERMEHELDELSAGLFEQANNMVREARLERQAQEDMRQLADESLVRSEELARSLQGKLGELTTELELSQTGHHRPMHSVMQNSRHLLSTTQPYTEFLLFVAHLRSLHPASPTPPSMSTLLSLPWLSRVGVEDVEPTLRLDMAPFLNWLSRRNVLSAIQHGHLTVEPVSYSFFSEHTNPPSCTLCGRPVLEHAHTSINGSTLAKLKQSISAYSQADRNSIATTASSKYSSPPPTPPRMRSPSIISSGGNALGGSQLYIFRVPSQLPNSTSQVSGTVTQTYPLCPSNTCYARLSATLALFAFIRSEVVGGVWREEIPETFMLPQVPRRNPSRQDSRSGLSSFVGLTNGGSPPPVPPRKRGLWGTMTGAWEKVAPASPTVRGFTSFAMLYLL